MAVRPISPVPDMGKIYTRDIQNELSSRPGVRSYQLGIGERIEVTVNGLLWFEDTGPLTVSINQD